MQSVYKLRDIKRSGKDVFNPELRIGFVCEGNDYINISTKQGKKEVNFLEIVKDSGGDNPSNEKDGIALLLTQDEAEFIFQTLKKIRKHFKLIPTTKDYAACP